MKTIINGPTRGENETGTDRDKYGSRISGIPTGINQTDVRQNNERLIIQLIRRTGGLPKAEIARITNLSAQTVSVTINRLLKEGLLIKRPPQKGKVGQPSVPISLNPEGAYSIGIKIGRHSIDILLMDFTGQVLEHFHTSYAFPKKEVVFSEIDRGLNHIYQPLSNEKHKRVVGIGVAAPYSIGGWEKQIDAPPDVLEEWRQIDLEEALKKRITPAPQFSNDATAACMSELVFGRGTLFDSFLYIFIGTFIGGGVVINGNMLPGRFGNSGAIGSMPVCLPGEKIGHHPHQLISHASLWSLKRRLEKAGYPPERVLSSPLKNDRSGKIIHQWIEKAAPAIAHAVVSATSVIDFDGIIIDGSLSSDTIHELVDRTKQAYNNMDLEGLIPPRIVPGSIGANARALGGALLPLYSAFAPDRNVFRKVEALKTTG